MTDAFGREITYLRLSVTDLCNLRCVYCMPETGVAKLRHEDILSVEELEEIVRAAARCGVTKVRITGGEPLVRRGILEICRRVAAVPGVAETCLTTNGVLLPQYAAALRAAGVARVNISLDTLDAAAYRAITRQGNLKDALLGLDAAVAAGFEHIKVNAVLLGGDSAEQFNNHVRQLVALTQRRMHVRFIELMPLGECADWARERFVQAEAVLQAVPELAPAGADGVAALYRLPGAAGTVGLIHPVSAHFCPQCNRVRVTADGKLKPCLHSPQEINLRGLHGADLEGAFRAAVLEKPQNHTLAHSGSGSVRNMNAIGG